MTITISKELFHVLSPVLYLSRFFCLQPLKWTKTSAGNYIITKSRFYTIYTLAASCLLVITSITGLSQVYQLDVIYLVRLGDTTRRFVTYSDIVVVLLPCVIGPVFALFKTNQTINYLSHLKQFDSLQNQPTKSTKIFQITALTTFCTAFTLSMDLFLWLKLSHNYIFLLCLPYYISYWSTVVIELLFWHFVHLIQIRISVINKKLAKMVVTGLNSVTTLKKPHAEVEDLVKGYEKLIEATNSINYCYGFPILVIILGCLIHLLVTPYGLYSIIMSTGDSTSILSQTVWMTAHILRLFLIIEPCHECFIKTKETSQLICKLLCLSVNQEVKKSLEFFLTYLGECKIEFSVYGFTKINRELLTTIAGAITTYLVILFQFK
ncbi:gustatory receptor for sugar taste 43a [Tribolium castaneum]|uniref:Gustatory receptor n=1 Tax=Tribolium castaneum TaxID=7070 RepID=D2EE66_TRICA|nr:PREDICTED: gustatory receptor for sugar taste 43a [Tribolium castaneum]EFA13587.1 gustatory receptor 21 [Tribolium castaneum]|eukprot:XP_008193365.2 PREDICTED: gustatory receptor for sugar taste 43a [Tribolium castaneum]